MSNRIEPLGPRDQDVKAIWPVLRRAVDRERETDEHEQKKRQQQRNPAPEPVVDQPGDYDGDGEHVDVRA